MMIDPFTQAMLDYQKHLRQGGKRIILPSPQRSGSKGLMYMSGVGPGQCPRKQTYQAEQSAGVREPDFTPGPLDSLTHQSGDLIADFLAEALAFGGHLIGDTYGYEVSVTWPDTNPYFTGRVDHLVDADTMPELVQEWGLRPRTLIVGDAKTTMGMNLKKHPKRWYVGQVEMYISALVDSGQAEEWGFKHVQPAIYQTTRSAMDKFMLLTWIWRDNGDCDVMRYGYKVPHKTFFNQSDEWQRDVGLAYRWRQMVEQSGWEVAARHRPGRVAERPELHRPDAGGKGWPFICCGQKWDDNGKIVKGMYEVHCPFFHTCWETGGDFTQFRWGSVINPADIPAIPF